LGASPWLIVLAVAVYGLVHSLLASLPVKSWVQRTFGASVGRFYRLAYNLFAGISFLPVLALLALLPDRKLYTISFPWALLGYALQFASVIILGVGVLQTGAWSFLGFRQLAAETSDQRPELVTGGLYRWVRHPLYTAGLLFIWALPVMTVNILALNIGLTVYIILGALHEEYRLEREFGEAYRGYKNRTAMLIPFVF
jgi:protein-S-isoprenylcysteine O-methyltransferase Ste14